MSGFELVIDARSDEIIVALLKDKRLVELHTERGNDEFSVGDIYFGKVRKVVPGLNAAFVDVGYEKDAFLHYLDLGPQFASLSKYTKKAVSGKFNRKDLKNFENEPDINKHGKVNEVLSQNQNIVVQVAKEPISTKGPRLCSELTIAGRFLVLVPFSDKISVSLKIKEQAERDRLKKLVTSIKPKNFGVIIRTVAENKKVAELDSDLSSLVSKWQEMQKALVRAKPPKRVLGEMNKTSTILRDLLTENFSSIHVNNKEVHEQIKDYILEIAPDKEKILRHYSGRLDIFEQFGIHKQIKASFGKHVAMSSGAYLIVEHTEAMHVIDVNSGNRGTKGKNQEQNALETNMEAAEEIARILRLRDMGGIIAVDFIDMVERENQRKLHDHLKTVMKADRAKHNVLAPSRFGVVEITRQRVRPETEIKTAESCPTCHGTGEVQSTVLIIDELESKMKYLAEVGVKDVLIETHPFIEAYLTKGFWSSIQKKWSKQYKIKIKVHGISAYHLLEYKFFDKDGSKLELD